jgi:rubrerythrin
LTSQLIHYNIYFFEEIKGGEMNLKEAIGASLEFEKKIRDHYKEAAEKSKSPAGKSFFGFLAREEEGHVSYLKKMGEEYDKQGAVPDEPLETIFTRTEWLIEGESELKSTEAKHNYEGEMERLLAALELEEEATRHYEKLVGVLGPEGKKLFGRFLEIEDTHTALVRAEVDYFNKSGYFYDFPEFSLEAME